MVGFHAGAALDARDSDGSTALHAAAAAGRLAAVALLVDAGADRGAKLHDGRTALDVAEAAGHAAVAARLACAGVTPEAQSDALGSAGRGVAAPNGAKPPAKKRPRPA